MEREITFKDLERAVEARHPELAELVLRFLAQPDLAPGELEEPPEKKDEEEPEPPSAPAVASDDDDDDEDDEDDDDDELEAPGLPEGAWTLPRLVHAISGLALASKTASERKAARREAWEGILGAPNPPPRLRLAKLLLDLYQAGDEQARGALLEILKDAPIALGPWQAMKRIYKLAEARHDAAMFGLLACRFDHHAPRPQAINSEISPGTFIYLRRRAWRYLRQLGLAVPEIYPQFAAEVLKHYPAGLSLRGKWVASHIWAEPGVEDPRRMAASGAPRDLTKIFFAEAWKLSAEPLLRLLEDAQNDTVADFAIRSLEKHFPESLRAADPRWLARIGKRPLQAVHEFIVKLLNDSPDFHQSKLRKLGLEEMVVSLLRSESATARKYAVEYARAQAPEIAIGELVSLLRDGESEVKGWAATRLEALSAEALGLEALIELLAITETRTWAEARLKKSFSPAALSFETFIRLSSGNGTQRKFVLEFYEAAKLKPPASFYQKLLEDPRTDWRAQNNALEVLGKNYSGKEIGSDWLKKALFERRTMTVVSGWLKAGMWKGEDLDLEWVKGLVMRPNLRPLAIELLSNTKLIRAEQFGMPWLLAMTRQADESLNQFAHRYLLENFSPQDFAQGGGSGIDRLWALATGKNEPETVRRFAASYLLAHHPEIASMKAQGIAPKLTLEAYPLTRLRPLFFDGRADVRELAAAIGKRDLVRWGDSTLLYALADSPYREGRRLAAELLLLLGEPEPEKGKVPPLEWLDARQVFALAESGEKSTRELALSLIRRHYTRLGSPSRLAWLMESPDREVRLFAVRLLFEKHRPLEVPAEWKPKKKPKDAPLEPSERKSAELATPLTAQFLRGTLFGLPPGRMERRELSGKDELPDRALPASVAKRRLIEVVRDLSLESSEFATIAVPILEEFARSEAKGEWQSCVAALARIRAEHPHALQEKGS